MGHLLISRGQGVRLQGEQNGFKDGEKGKNRLAVCGLYLLVYVGEFSRVKTRWHNLSAAIRNCCAPLAKRKRECAL